MIDGQQRLTTLQILLDAAQLVVEQELGEDESESLQEVLTNRGARFRGSPKRFKLIPSRLDFEVFDAVSRGTAQIGHSAAYFWRDKAAAAPFFLQFL